MSTEPLGNIAADPSLAMAGQGDVEHLKTLAEGGEKNLKEVAAQFESIFLNMLIKQMWESVDRSGLTPETTGRQVYDGLLTTLLADHLSQNGGIGIADAMVSQLKHAAAAYEEQVRALEGEEGVGSKHVDSKDLTRESGPPPENAEKLVR